MSAVLEVLGLAWIFCVAVPVLVLLVEVLAGWAAMQRTGRVQPPGDVPPYAVLVPAHDEEGTVHSTIAVVRWQLPAVARLLVVADNCSDGTADEARAAGAEVVERHDPLLRGKGHALAFGVEHLRKAPPAVVVVLDADCIPAPGALDLLAATAARLGRPVQGSYAMLALPDSPLEVRMAAFAWAAKNQLRPLGLVSLGLPCQLMGSGMAFPWSCIGGLALGSGHLTEDLQLGVKLAEAGHAARFCPQARVVSAFPQQRSALESQRRRWEHGHLSMILAGVPRLALGAWRPGRAGSLALALDLLVPPLALLALLVLLSCGVAAALGIAQGSSRLAAAVAAASLLAFVAAVLLMWWAVGRRWVGLAELLRGPAYVLRKLPLYAAFVVRRQREWVRTSRRHAARD